MDVKIQSITNATAEQVQTMCSCNFNDDNIVEEVFSCRASTMDPNLENTVVYRAKVTPQLPVSVIDANDIVQIIGTWVQSAPSIAVNRLILNIDPNCPTILESFDAEDCLVITATTTTTTASSVQLPLPTIQPSSVNDNSKSTGIIVGATIAAIVVVVLAVVIVVLIILHCRLKSNYR